jgi:hypothetical protein
VTISASYNGSTQTATLTVQAPAAETSEFGWTDPTGSTGWVENADLLICGARGAPSSSGTVDVIYLYSSNTSSNLQIKVGLYRDNAGLPGTKVGTEGLAATSGPWAAQWADFHVSYPVTGSTTYWICYQLSRSSVFTEYYTDPGSGSNFVAKYLPWGQAWPSTFGTPTYNLSPKIISKVHYVSQ